jgi:hypothetical protein
MVSSQTFEPQILEKVCTISTAVVKEFWALSRTLFRHSSKLCCIVIHLLMRFNSQLSPISILALEANVQLLHFTCFPDVKHLQNKTKELLHEDTKVSGHVYRLTQHPKLFTPIEGSKSSIYTSPCKISFTSFSKAIGSTCPLN